MVSKMFVPKSTHSNLMTTEYNCDEKKKKMMMMIFEEKNEEEKYKKKST